MHSEGQWEHGGEKLRKTKDYIHFLKENLRC